MDETTAGPKGLFEQMRQVKERMEAMERRLAEQRVEAEAGGGMVRAVVTGRRDLLRIDIEPEVFGGGDRELVQDLVVAAVNAAMAKAEAAIQQQMESAFGGLAGGMLPDLGIRQP